MTNLVDYRDKRVVVTGGSSGVGAELVTLLRACGAAHITAVDLKPGSGPIDQMIVADLSDPVQVDAAAAEVVGEVHALFNNAGVAATFPADVVMAVNVFAPQRLTDRLLDRMPSGAAVANTASMAGFGYPAHLGQIQELLAIDDWAEALEWIARNPELMADRYGFSKECAQVFTLRGAAALRQRGIRVNSVCPAVIETPLLKDFSATMGASVLDWTVSQSGGRRATPVDVANVLAFLGSDAAAYVSGANVPVDNGFTAARLTNQLDYASLPRG